MSLYCTVRAKLLFVNRRFSGTKGADPAPNCCTGNSLFLVPLKHKRPFSLWGMMPIEIEIQFTGELILYET